MPHKWESRENGAPEISGASSYRDGGAPLRTLHIWPHRSLPRGGFVTFIGVTFALLMIPMIAVLGTPVLWGILPFGLGALALLWYFLERSYKDGTLVEELRLWPDRIELTRHNPRAPRQDWHANPYWVSVQIYAEGGPVENYLTLKGGGREVELGAFLSPEERETLRDELQTELARLPRV